MLGGDRVSEESSILERLKGLETEQKNVQLDPKRPLEEV